METFGDASELFSNSLSGEEDNEEDDEKDCLFGSKLINDRSEAFDILGEAIGLFSETLSGDLAFSTEAALDTLSGEEEQLEDGENTAEAIGGKEIGEL